jgi:hypothetical protein
MWGNGRNSGAGTGQHSATWMCNQSSVPANTVKEGRKELVYALLSA